MINPEFVFPFIEVGPCDAGPGQAGQAAWTARLKITESLPYFEGHFPGNPVLPAVAILDATLEAVRTALGDRTLEFEAILSAKFMRPVKPGERMRIELRKIDEKAHKSQWKSLWKLEASGESVAEIAFHGVSASAGELVG